MANYVKNCENCEKAYEATRSDSRFCSASCRTASNKKQANKRRVVVPAVSGVGFDHILDELRQIRALLTVQGERILTVDQAIKELDISRITFERLQAEGAIQVYRFGGREGRGRGRKPYVLFSELIRSLKQDNTL
jgi:predicted nucleic acid-binding Zn ribbon protein